MKEEAKLGNIPYKEAIELQKENEKLQARLKEVEGRNEYLEKLVSNLQRMNAEKDEVINSGCYGSGPLFLRDNQ